MVKYKTYDEAKDALKKVRWKTKECGTKNCWCLMILPEDPIYYDYKGDEEVYVASAGALSKDIAEYIVELHNNSLEKS